MRKPTPEERLTEQLLEAPTVEAAWKLYAAAAIGPGHGYYSRKLGLGHGHGAFVFGVRWILETIFRDCADGDLDGIKAAKRLEAFLQESREYGDPGGRKAGP